MKKLLRTLRFVRDNMDHDDYKIDCAKCELIDLINELESAEIVEGNSVWSGCWDFRQYEPSHPGDSPSLLIVFNKEKIL